MPFTSVESGWLLSGRCDLRAVGPVDWRDVNSSYVAALPLTANDVEPNTARFVYRIPKKRADQPTLLITLRDESTYRLDVNGSHREGPKLYPFVTHIQRLRSSPGQESYEPNPVGIPHVDIGKRVTPHLYRAILGAFAAPIGMDILDVEWSDPPEGRQP